MSTTSICFVIVGVISILFGCMCGFWLGRTIFKQPDLSKITSGTDNVYVGSPESHAVTGPDQGTAVICRGDNPKLEDCTVYGAKAYTREELQRIINTGIISK